MLAAGSLLLSDCKSRTNVQWSLLTNVISSCVSLHSHATWDGVLLLLERENAAAHDIYVYVCSGHLPSYATLACVLLFMQKREYSNTWCMVFAYQSPRIASCIDVVLQCSCMHIRDRLGPIVCYIGARLLGCICMVYVGGESTIICTYEVPSARRMSKDLK